MGEEIPRIGRTASELVPIVPGVLGGVRVWGDVPPYIYESAGWREMGEEGVWEGGDLMVIVWSQCHMRAW